MTKFKAQALHIIGIKYCNVGGNGNPLSLISALWNSGILLHKQATHAKHFDGECTTCTWAFRSREKQRKSFFF